MAEISNFSIGDIVTLKSHPLFKDYSVNVFSQHAPPLMLIKEVFFENKKKRTYSEEINEAIISDKVKYSCVYFEDKKSEFIEVILYQSVLEGINKANKMNFFRIKDKEGKETKSRIKLLDEIDSEYTLASYVFGNPVMFKTSKLEYRKRLKTSYSYPSFTSPDFVLSGIKKENPSDLFYEDGKPKKRVSEILYKVMWYNHVHQKFSEKYLPKEFFIEPLNGKPIIEENKKPIKK